MYTGGYGCGRDLKFVVSIAVKAEAMTADDIAKWENAEDEEERTEHGTLGNALRERSSGG